MLLVAPPNRPPLLGALDVLLVLFAVPKRDVVAPPVEGVAPKRGLLGVLLLPLPLFCWPNRNGPAGRLPTPTYAHLQRG